MKTLAITSAPIALLALVVLPCAHADSVIEGAYSSASRGYDVIDIQSYRLDTDWWVAEGDNSITFGTSNHAAGGMSMAIGHYNVSSAFYSIAIGGGNSADGENSVSMGYGNLAGGYKAVAFGSENYVSYYSGSDPGFRSIAVGALNTINIVDSDPVKGVAVGLSNLVGGARSSAIGRDNSVTKNDSIAVGHGNTVSVDSGSVFGIGISNTIAGSTMIGPSNTAKVTISSSGNVGIGLGAAAPAEKLHVGGNLKVTGTISSPSLGLSGTGSTSRLLVGGTMAPVSSWQGTTAIGGDGQNKVIAGYLASATNGAVIGAHNSALSSWADLNVAGSNLIFRTNESERMRLASNGSLGIGTATPGATNSGSGQTKLDVVGTGGTNVTVQDSTGYASFTAAGQSEANVSLRDMGAASGSQVWNINNNGGLLSFRRLGDGYTPVLSTPVVFASDGSVGIGTSTPAAKLEVNGGAQFSGAIKMKNKAVIRMSAAGDIGMGSFQTGANPEL